MEKSVNTVHSEPTVEIDLLELLLYFLKRWVWFLLALILGCAAAFALYFFTVKPIYKASSEIYVTNSGTVISVQDVQLSDALTEDYREIILSRTVLKKVISDQNLDMDYKALKSCVSVSTPNDSHCMVISATADTPEEAVDITNCLVRYGIDHIYRIVGKDEPCVIDPAELDAVVEVQTSWVKYVALGGMVGFILIGVLFTLLFLMDTTLKTDADVEKYLDLNVLAVIPESSSSQKSKGGRRKANE